MEFKRFFAKQLSITLLDYFFDEKNIYYSGAQVFQTNALYFDSIQYICNIYIGKTKEDNNYCIFPVVFFFLFYSKGEYFYF